VRRRLREWWTPRFRCAWWVGRSEEMVEGMVDSLVQVCVVGRAE